VTLAVGIQVGSHSPLDRCHLALMKNIETSIQHVTKTGTNLFAELGFPPQTKPRNIKPTRWR
jgi:hypothetical protein